MNFLLLDVYLNLRWKIYNRFQFTWLNYLQVVYDFKERLSNSRLGSWPRVWAHELACVIPDRASLLSLRNFLSSRVRRAWLYKSWWLVWHQFESIMASLKSWGSYIYDLWKYFLRRFCVFHQICTRFYSVLSLLILWYSK